MKKRGCFFILSFPNALLSFAQSFTGIVLSDLIVYRTCLVTPNVNRTNCSMLNDNPGSPEALLLEAEVERYASIILMVKSLIESLLPTMLFLFIGPWSDRGGRRPLLLGGFTGFIMMFAALSLICNWDISPWYLLIPSIPAYVMGGQCAVTLASNCYISDTTEQKGRTVLLAWLQMSITIGTLLGTFTGPFLYKNYGYTTVFGIATICFTCALLHIYFFLPESIKGTSKLSLQTLFRISFLKEIVASSVVQRDGFHRAIVWLAVFIFTIFTMIILGDANQAFLFTRARLGWDVQDLSYLCGTGNALTITGLFGISLLNPILGLPDTLLAGIGLMSALATAIMRSFTWKAWHMYLAAVLGMFNGVVGPAIRSIVTKFIPAQDVGKVFSLVALLETLSPLGGGPLLTLVYTRYLPPIYPSPVYLFTSSFLILLLLCTVCIEVLSRKSRHVSYNPAAQEDITS